MDDPTEPRDLAPIPEHLSHLTAMQQAFVCNYVENGGKGGDAAIAAGYAPSGAAPYASRMLSNPLIIKAIYGETVQRLGAYVPAALDRVAKLAASARSEYVQLEASKDLLDRAGLSAPKRVDVSGQFSVSIDLS